MKEDFSSIYREDCEEYVAIHGGQIVFEIGLDPADSQDGYWVVYDAPGAERIAAAYRSAKEAYERSRSAAEKLAARQEFEAARAAAPAGWVVKRVRVEYSGSHPEYGYTDTEAIIGYDPTFEKQIPDDFSYTRDIEEAVLYSIARNTTIPDEFAGVWDDDAWRVNLDAQYVDPYRLRRAWLVAPRSMYELDISSDETLPRFPSRREAECYRSTSGTAKDHKIVEVRIWK